MKKKSKSADKTDPPRICFKFPDGSIEEMPLAEYEEHLLRQPHEMARSQSPILRRLGDDAIKREAEARAQRSVVAVQKRERHARLTAAGAAGRRRIGQATASRVISALARGRLPDESERHTRRIKNRSK